MKYINPNFNYEMFRRENNVLFCLKKATGLIKSDFKFNEVSKLHAANLIFDSNFNTQILVGYCKGCGYFESRDAYGRKIIKGHNPKGCIFEVFGKDELFDWMDMVDDRIVEYLTKSGLVVYDCGEYYEVFDETKVKEYFDKLKNQKQSAA